MTGETPKIPSDYLRGVNADVADGFRAARAAIEKAGPLDYPTRELIMLSGFAASGFEESFRIHVRRAAARGISKPAMQQAVLILFGATTALLPVVNALRWIDEEFAQQDGAGPRTVRSADGTMIGYVRSGEGAPLLLVHGATSDRSRWRPVQAALDARYGVHAMDRRGRGASGDATAYALQREVEDVVALVEAIGAPVHVLAHSYGAVCALEASRVTANMRSLILYEPPMSTPATPPEQQNAQDAVIREIEACVAKGDRAGALDTFYRKNLRMPEAELEALHRLPDWPNRLALAHTLPRELREVWRYRFDPTRFREHRVPTLVVLGGDSAPRYHDSTAMLKAGLPGSQVAVLAGHQHVAINTGPELFAATVHDFLRRH